MNVASLEFILLLILAAAAFFVLPGARARQFAFAACSAGFLYSYIPDPRGWLVLLGFLFSGFGCAQVLRLRPSRVLFTAYIVLLIAAFAFLKKYDFLKLCIPERMLDLRVEVVGISYMLFRQIHFVVDMMQGQIERPTLWAYLNYQLNPFTLLAGPIQRYQDFQGYWDEPVPLARDRHEVLKAYLRLFIGVLKIVLVAEAFHVVYNLLLGWLETGPRASSSAAVGVTAYDLLRGQIDAAGDPSRAAGLKTLAGFLAMLYSYLMYLYMNFSGYCDIVIAGASLVGLRLPENFNYPFFARNILDYWSRWHITLGHWIRDYLFTPFYKAGAERFPRHTATVAVNGYFVAFTLAGIWHGSTWNFLVFGLLHGAGAAAAKLWENTIVAHAGRSGLRNYLKSPTIRRVAIVATFHYVCFTLFFFALDLGRGQRILETVLQSIAPGN